MTDKMTEPEDKKKFGEKYYDRVLEFDGSIDYLVNHASSRKVYKTRFDLLLSYGDYDADHQMGPTLQVRNIGGPTIAGLNLGSNVHVKATHFSYDENCDKFQISIESIEAK